MDNDFSAADLGWPDLTPERAAREVERLVAAYLSAHDEFELSESARRHPAIAALGTAVSGWIGRVLGAPIEVKAHVVIGCHHWFTDRRDALTLRIIENLIFVAREQGCAFDPRYDRLWRGFVAWRKHLPGE